MQPLIRKCERTWEFWNKPRVWRFGRQLQIGEAGDDRADGATNLAEDRPVGRDGDPINARPGGPKIHLDSLPSVVVSKRHVAAQS